MKIIYLHQYFKTPNMTGGTRSYEMAKRLVAAGHEVIMITSWTDQTTNTDWSYENIDDIDVYWYPNSYSNKMSFTDRIKSFIRFAKSASIKASSFEDADIIFATSTPLTIAIPAIYASKLLEIPMVFEVRDLWPELPISIGALKNPLLKFIAGKLEYFAYHNSDAIVALSPGMKKGIMRTGFPSDKIAVIPNSSDNFEFKHNTTEAKRFRDSRPWLNNSPLLVYTGTLGKINGVVYLVELAKQLKALDSDIKILIVGDGADKQEIIKAAKTDNVFEFNLFIEPPMPKKDIPALLSAATMASALFIDLPEMRPNSANKFFDALASGTPVLINYGGWMNELVINHSCGLACWQLPINEVALKLESRMHNQKWLNEASKAARKLAENEFDRDKLANQLISVLDSVISNQPTKASNIAPGIY